MLKPLSTTDGPKERNSSGRSSGKRQALQRTKRTGNERSCGSSWNACPPSQNLPLLPHHRRPLPRQNPLHHPSRHPGTRVQALPLLKCHHTLRLVLLANSMASLSPIPPHLMVNMSLRQAASLTCRGSRSNRALRHRCQRATTQWHIRRLLQSLLPLVSNTIRPRPLPTADTRIRHRQTLRHSSCHRVTCPLHHRHGRSNHPTHPLQAHTRPVLGDTHKAGRTERASTTRRPHSLSHPPQLTHGRASTRGNEDLGNRSRY